VQYLNSDVSAKKLNADGLGADYYFSVFQNDKNWIPNAKKIGIIVGSWVVDNSPDMDTLLSQNIDFITTNEPELLLKKIGK
jgi:glycerophosphoryl diester phosphodiesterase